MTTNFNNNINNIVYDLEKLRGADVRVFGQPTKLDGPIDDNELIVDTIDIVSEFRGLEVDIQAWEWDINDQLYNESIDGNIDDIEFSSIDDFLDYLQELDYINIDDYKGDNSYNYSGYFSNELDWKIYNSNVNGTVYVVLKAHRYGDVRGNYTEEVLLEFTDEHEFLEIISEYKYIALEVDGVNYSISISGTSDSIDVYDQDGGMDLGECYGDIDDVIDYIRAEVQ